MESFKDIAPVKVSPIVKGTRWILLISGIAYGISKQQLYSHLEGKHNEDKKRLEEMKVEKLAEERKRRHP